MVRNMVLEFKRNRLVKELNDRNIKIFNDIVEYIGVGTMSPIEQEEVFQQILDMMLQAQSQGKFVGEVIGNDIKSFCDSIIKESSCNKNIFNKCFNYIESVFQFLVGTFLMIFIFDVFLGGWNYAVKDKSIKMFDFISIGLICSIIFPIYFKLRRKQIFKDKKHSKNYAFVILFISMIILSYLMNMFLDSFPKIGKIGVIKNGNEIVIIAIIIIAFGRDVCYLTKSIYKKFCENK